MRSTRSRAALDMSKYLAAVEDYEQKWMLLDQTLYELCDRHPSHTDCGAINAKLWLIGRGFATGVERHIKSSGAQGSSMSRLAIHLLQHGDEVDSLVQRLRQVHEPLDAEKLATIVALHGQFCELVSQIANGGSVLASFSSKYLHFQAPVVPIYDSWVYDQAWRMRRKDDLACFPQPEHANSKFYWYSLCFWQVYSELSAAAPRVNVRYADYYLMWLANS